MPAGREPAVWAVARLAAGELWLDLRAGAIAERAEGAPAPAPAGAVVLDDGGEPAPRAEDGRHRVSRAVVWSLLDPLAAARGNNVVAPDPVTAEQALRAEGERFWAGIARWREWPEETRQRIGRLLGDHHPALAALVAALDVLAAGGGAGPFGTSPSVAAAPPAGQPPAPVPDDGPGWERWFQDPDGLGRLLGPAFAPRPGQGVMARDVAEALAAGRPLLLEAGTGVGKTLAYLLPLAAAVVRADERGVVSTHTLALQDQILARDLPLLQRLWPGLRVRRLMGRTHYLCRLRSRRFLAAGGGGLPRDWARASLLAWLAVTREGRREEVADHPALKPWLRELFDSAEPCSPAVCHGEPPCYVQRARQRAREADLVVVNHSLLLHDLAADRSLVGEYRHLVVDEAHRLPGVALEVHALRCDRRRADVVEELLGGSAGAGRLPEVPRRLAADLDRRGDAGKQAAALVTGVVERFGRALQAYRDWLDGVAGQWGGPGREFHRQRIHDAAETFGPVADRVAGLLEATAAAAAAWNRFAAAVEQIRGLDDAAAERLATLARCRELLAALEGDVAFLTGPVPEEWVFFLEGDGRGGLRAVTGTPLEPGPLLAQRWREHDLAPVGTSATLSVAGDFSFLAAELGLDRGELAAVTSLVPSPFRYDRQALVLTLPVLPPPEGAHYLAVVGDLLRRLAMAVPRKAMALFTSYAHLEEVARRLGSPRPGTEAAEPEPAVEPLPGVTLLVQRPGSDGADLMRRFRRAERALLLGTSTFWEGIDLPGEHLELLVVAKLPFMVPNDPWVEARCELIQRHGGQPFRDFMIRDAVLRLRQGVGRLIRGPDDRGVVLILDSRLHTKGYGGTFLKSLPVRARACGSVEEAVALAGAFFTGREASG